jgi:hypothetical protein
MNKSILLKFFILISVISFAQVQKMNLPEVVKWSFTSEQVAGTSDEFVLKFTAKVDKGWHIYSQTVTDGPVPTSFKFTVDDKSYRLIGTTEEPKGEKIHDIAFDADIISFEGTVVFTQKIKVVSNPSTFNVELEYMTCNNSQCNPPKTVSFTFNIAGK